MISIDREIIFIDTKISDFLNLCWSNLIILDAGEGIKTIQEKIKELDLKNENSNWSILTNSVYVLDELAPYTYDNKSNIHNAFYRFQSEEGQIVFPLALLTDRELKVGHKLGTMFCNGEFNDGIKKLERGEYFK